MWYGMGWCGVDFLVTFHCSNILFITFQTYLFTRCRFRLPLEAKLDGDTECSIWLPYTSNHAFGTFSLSTLFICFSSRVGVVGGRGVAAGVLLVFQLSGYSTFTHIHTHTHTHAQVRDLVSVVIPLTEVDTVEIMDKTSKSESIIITTFDSNIFIFSKLPKRDIVLKSLVDLIKKVPANHKRPSQVLMQSNSMTYKDRNVKSRVKNYVRNLKVKTIVFYKNNRSSPSPSSSSFSSSSSSLPLRMVFKRKGSDGSIKEGIKMCLWKTHFEEYGRLVCLDNSHIYFLLWWFICGVKHSRVDVTNISQLHHFTSFHPSPHHFHPTLPQHIIFYLTTPHHHTFPLPYHTTPPPPYFTTPEE